MPRTRIKTLTWETVVQELVSERTRFIIRKKQNQSPYIKVDDTTNGKRYSLQPLFWEVIEAVNRDNLFKRITSVQWYDAA